jgi:hypothetical protein
MRGTWHAHHLGVGADNLLSIFVIRSYKTWQQALFEKHQGDQKVVFDPAKDTPCPDYIKTSNKYSSVSGHTLIERKNWQSILKNEAPDLVGIAFSKMPCIVFYFFPNGYHGQKKYQKKNPLKFVKFSLWVKPEAVGIAPVSPALASPCASPYYCASLIPLHQKSLGGTVKAIIHHPTDFAGVQ